MVSNCFRLSTGFRLYEAGDVFKGINADTATLLGRSEKPLVLRMPVGIEKGKGGVSTQQWVYQSLALE